LLPYETTSLSCKLLNAQHKKLACSKRGIQKILTSRKRLNGRSKTFCLNIYAIEDTLIVQKQKI
jgi:hypothetical protein